MNLRSNQVEPVRIGIEFFKQKKSKPSIIVAPTAFGKSIVIASIAKGIGDKVIVLQPNRELLDQNYNKFTALGGVASIYSASMNTKEIGDVTYATIGSIIKVASEIKQIGITKLIVDECDRFPRESSGMLRTFIDASGITHVLGFTATPIKLQNNLDEDKNPISKLVMLTSKSKKGNFFKDIIHVTQIKQMVELGFWSKLIYETHDFDESKLTYNSSKSDYTEKSLDIAYRFSRVEDKIVHKVNEITNRKSILIAVPSIKHALELERRIPSCRAVHSELKKEDRDAVVEDFKSGKLRVVAQVNILSVGFDHPELDCIITGRPTASLSWWYQFVGRATRIHPNKKDALVIDFVGSTKRFGKVEELYFKKQNDKWQLFGESQNLISDIPMHEIGLHKEGKPSDFNVEKSMLMPFGKYVNQRLHTIPKSYRNWLLDNITWDANNETLRKQLMRLKEYNL